MLISQGIVIISSVLLLLCLTFSIISIILGLRAIIEIKALKMSTHTFQYVDPAEAKANEESVENWGTKSASLVKQQELYKEDLEETLPDFVEEDIETYSF